MTKSLFEFLPVLKVLTYNNIEFILEKPVNNDISCTLMQKYSEELKAVQDLLNSFKFE